MNQKYPFLESLLLEMPVLNPDTARDITKALKAAKKTLSKDFTVQKIEVKRKGEVTPTQRSAGFESRIKFPPVGRKGSPFSAAKILSDKAHDEIVDIVKKELSKIGIKSKSLDDVGRGARAGEAVFSIDELGKGWISIFVQFGIPKE